LNESDMLTWFFNALKRSSKIPFTRFDKTNGGGTVYGDMTEMSRDELHFYQFVQRLRTVFKEIIIKPWKIKMILDFPELEKDENFMTKINVKFNGANLFHEWKQMSNLNKRAELIGNLSNNLKDKDGASELSLKYLIKRYLGYTDEELAENERYKKMSGVGSAESSGMGMDTGGGGSSPSMDMGGESGGEPSPVEQAAPTEATPTSSQTEATPPTEDKFDF
jgi:Bacteriophage T4-like portal protein (Gp20)